VSAFIEFTNTCGERIAIRKSIIVAVRRDCDKGVAIITDGSEGEDPANGEYHAVKNKTFNAIVKELNK